MEHAQCPPAPVVFARFARRRWKTQIRIAFAAIAAAAVMGYSAYQYLDYRDAAAEARAPTSGRTTIQAPGVVHSLRSAGTGSTFDGTVAAVFVRQGQAVRRGQLLFRMDVIALKNELQSAQARVRDTNAALADLYERRKADVRELEEALLELESAYLPETANHSPEGEAPVIASSDTGIAEGYDADRRQQIEIVNDQLRQKLLPWEPALREAKDAHRAAQADVARIKIWLGQIDRRAPIDGVVTELHAAAGKWLGAHQTAVRVDDPRAYRVVTLVRGDAREGLKPGAPLMVTRPDGPERARLEKIVAGWDREVFRYWLWLKPQDPKGLTPGQQVRVTVSEQRLLAFGGPTTDERSRAR